MSDPGSASLNVMYSPVTMDPIIENLNETLNMTLTLATNRTDTRTTMRVYYNIFEYHAPFAVYFNKYVTPVAYVIGMVGNVISALFWSSQRMRTTNTAAIYLTALAVADFCYLVLHVFYELENPWLVPTLGVTGWCQVWNVLYMAFSYLCVFLVCAFTFERFLSICFPFK